MYAASVMFGYFVRRVDKRFQLAKSMGLLPESREDTVARLERLFQQVLAPSLSTGSDIEGRRSTCLFSFGQLWRDEGVVSHLLHL